MEVGHQAYGTYYTKQRLSSCVIQRKCQQHLKLLMSLLYTFINVNFKRWPNCLQCKWTRMRLNVICHYSQHLPAVKFCKFSKKKIPCGTLPSNFKLSVSLTFLVYWHTNLSIWHENTNCCQNKRAITLNLNKDSLIANHSGTCLQLENSLTIIGHVWFRQTQLLSWFWYRNSVFDLNIRFGLKRYFNYILFN